TRARTNAAITANGRLANVATTATRRLSAIAVQSSAVGCNQLIAVSQASREKRCSRKICAATGDESQARNASASGLAEEAVTANGYTMGGCVCAGNVSTMRTRGSACASVA